MLQSYDNGIGQGPFLESHGTIFNPENYVLFITKDFILKVALLSVALLLWF